MKRLVEIASEQDAREIAALRNAAGEELTRRFGSGVWSWRSSENMIRYNLTRPKFSRTLVAREGRKLLGVLTLQAKKPWAIDVSYFTPVKRPLYLVGMTVHPANQGQGVGRELLKSAEVHAREWPADAIRLDAFDSKAGAGPFYAKCGYQAAGRSVYRGTPHLNFELVF